MKRQSGSPDLAGSRRFVDRFPALLGGREPAAVATEALSAVLHDLGAVGGSLFYAARPPVRVRCGDLPAAAAVQVDHWEASVGRRILSGPSTLDVHEEPITACIPPDASGPSLIHGLLLDGQEIGGAVSLVLPGSMPPTPRQIRLLHSFVQSTGGLLGLVSELALNKARLGQLSLFYQIGQSLASTFDLSRVLDETVELTSAVIEASASALMLVDEPASELVFEFAHGELGAALCKQRAGVDEGIAGWVATHGIPALVNDVGTDPRFSPVVDTRTGFCTSCVVCVPLQVRGKTLGVLEAYNKRGGQGFDAEDLALMLTIAGQAAIAIENARLYQSVREERDRIVQAQENVRRQLARNLHDGTIQYLSAINMNIDYLERVLEFRPETAHSELNALRDLTRQATQQARLALFELRPLILETRGLVAALEAYVDQLQESESFAVHFEPPAARLELSPSVARTIFAIVQEAINNVKKHAGAHDVWLRLSCTGGWFQVDIEDNGKGFDLESVERDYDGTGSIGVLSMRERAGMIDGLLDIQSQIQSPDSGTRVSLRIPHPRCP